MGIRCGEECGNKNCSGKLDYSVGNISGEIIYTPRSNDGNSIDCEFISLVNETGAFTDNIYKDNRGGTF